MRLEGWQNNFYKKSPTPQIGCYNPFYNDRKIFNKKVILLHKNDKLYIKAMMEQENTFIDSKK